MRLALVWFALSACTSAPALSGIRFEDLPIRDCRRSLENILFSLALPNSRWQRNISTWPDEMFRAPSTKIGRWMELQIHVNGSMVLTEIQVGSRHSWRIDARRNCFLSTTRAVRTDPKPPLEVFDDSRLEKVVRSHARGVIYAWSPHMPVSFYGLPRIADAAKKLNLSVHFVLDPHADSAQARREALRNGLPAEALLRMESLELIFRGMPNHYPTVVVFAGGRIRGNPIPGVKEGVAYERMILDQLRGE